MKAVSNGTIDTLLRVIPKLVEAAKGDKSLRVQNAARLAKISLRKLKKAKTIEKRI